MKRTVYNRLHTKVNSLEKKIPGATTLIHKNQYNTDKRNFEKKIRDLQNKTPDVSGLVTATVLITKIENKIPDTSSLGTTALLNTKIGDVEYKIFDVRG